MKQTPLKITGSDLTLFDIEDVARRGRPVVYAREALARIKEGRRFVEAIIERGDVVYGINTGFGILSDVRIEREAIVELQRNLIVSHSIGVGAALPPETVRAIMLLRANVLAKGASGVRVETALALLAMLNNGVHPFVPEQGSVGASGDLAPLAHLTLAMIGEGQAEYRGALYEGSEALSRAGLAPLVLEAKEGLALINGTQVMTAIGALATLDAWRAAKYADIAGALCVEALLGSVKPFDARIQALRPHPGQIAVAANLRKLLKGSPIVRSHKNCSKVQDAYSLRCMPQVHGASRDALRYAWQVLEIEANSGTDNPLVFASDEEVISGGNFHGQPVAIAMDLAGIATAELANISERRVEQLVNPALSSGLPAFLVSNKGLNSGYMIAQVTSAALVSENKVLAHPSSVDSIPSSAGREDHVSMGTIGARKFRSILTNVQNSLAIEILCAAQAIDFRAPLACAKGTGAALACLRREVPFLDHDRALYLDQRKVMGLLQSGDLLAAVETAIGTLE